MLLANYQFRVQTEAPGVTAASLGEAGASDLVVIEEAGALVEQGLEFFCVHDFLHTGWGRGSTTTRL